MPGIRLTHDTLRNGTLTVIHPTKRYKAPYWCGKCKEIHYNKAIHVWLGDDGSGIVSKEAYELLRQSGMGGLHFSNVVAEPPMQYVSVDLQPVNKEEKIKFLAPVTKKEYQGHMRRLHVLKNRLFIPKEWV